MDTPNKTVTLTFLPIPPIRISRTGTTYPALMGDTGAYQAAENLDVLQIRTLLTPLVETPVFDKDIEITLVGGKAANYVDAADYTVIRGSMSIRSGKVAVNRIKIQ
jgi:hypothetical protein